MRFYSLLLLILVLTSSVAAEPTATIAEVQGNGYYSPLADKKVTVQGVVTAIKRRGFYIQTPDNKKDDDQKTSEGLYIFTYDPPPEKVEVGNLVEVSGKVAEFKPEKEIYALFVTEIIEPKTKILSVDNPLPEAVEITTKDLKPDGQIDQLERFEGMRVKVERMDVVAPTGGFFDFEKDTVRSDGVFFAVLPKTPRPFREPGLGALKVLIDKLPRSMPIFDMNPELLRVESNGLNGGTPIDVTVGASIENVVGIVDYSYRSYTLLIDHSQEPKVTNNREFVAASPAGEGEVTVASFNVENLFDDEENSDLGGRKETMVSSEHFEKRLKKISLAVRNVVSMPDVLGIVEVENQDVLIKLAERINSDAVAAGQPDPRYASVHKESNDVRGIDVGFLVKSTKIRTLNTEHLGAELKHKHPDANPKETLFSRPPILSEFETISDDKPFKFTVVVNHLKSYRGIESSRVQNKRRRQAEFLAETVSRRQSENPLEKIILIGDFNAFQFNDGYNDLIGTLKGKPEKNVLTPAEKVFETGLVNLVDYITEPNRYSYVFGGSAQTLDHILINKPTIPFAAKFGYARFNADFPKVYANDETRPERVSDHDVPVLYLKTVIRKVEETQKP